MALLRSSDTAELIARRRCPRSPWSYSCSTIQAAVLGKHLHTHQTVHPDHLAFELAEAYALDPKPSYGSNTRTLLERIHGGESWRTLSPSSFAGFGSMGTGAAIRVLPVGIHYANDIDRAVDAARLSARVTHANTNSIEGTAAVAVTTAFFARGHADPQAVWDTLLSRLKPSFTRERIARASELAPSTAPEAAAEALGNGRWKCAHDTVPFALWCALNHGVSYRSALWFTAMGAGRLHATCALVAGLLAAGGREPPPGWQRQTDHLPGFLTPRRPVGIRVSPYRRTSALP